MDGEAVRDRALLTIASCAIWMIVHATSSEALAVFNA
jgi:hypothetical protein